MHGLNHPSFESCSAKLVFSIEGQPQRVGHLRGPKEALQRAHKRRILSVIREHQPARAACRLLVLACGKGDRHWQLCSLTPSKRMPTSPDVDLRKALLCRSRLQSCWLKVLSLTLLHVDPARQYQHCRTLHATVAGSAGRKCQLVHASCGSQAAQTSHGTVQITCITARAKRALQPRVPVAPAHLSKSSEEGCS
jgi:hypothetical protein